MKSKNTTKKKVKQVKCGNRKSFLQRHPRLNTLLALLILIIIGIFIYYAITFMFSCLAKVMNWIKEFSSNTDAVLVVGMLTAGVSIFSVFMTSIIAKYIDARRQRREYLAQKRELPYAQFIDMVYKIQRNVRQANSYTEKEMLEDISKFSQQLTLWGSPKVVDKWIQFRENSMNPDEARNNLFILEEVMNEMRKDMGLKKTQKGNLLAFFVNDIKKELQKK